jgi:CRISPR-associated protein Cmr6
VSARRRALDNLTRRTDTHAGLWLDKYLREQTTDTSSEDQKKAKAELLGQVAELAMPLGYAEAFELREVSVGSSGSTARIGRAHALGRTVVGLGQKGPSEVGITLEHTWGVPVLPGSSLKGVAAAAAHLLFGGKDWEKRALDANGASIDREWTSFDWLFGTTEVRGAVEFHDAWWIPDEKKRPLDLDVMTVHHPDYYAGKDVPPADTDSPNPVAFLTTSGDFRVMLSGDSAWVDAAWQLLEVGLAELGIGAKSNAGYGRMRLERLESRAEREAREARDQWSTLVQLPVRLKGMGNANDIFQEFASAVRGGCPVDLLRVVARDLVTGPHRKMWKDWAKKDSRKPEERDLFTAWFQPHLA